MSDRHLCKAKRTDNGEWAEGNYEKPPLGAAPSFIVIPARIIDLAAAISRFADSKEVGNDKEKTRAIRMWANEIICHCDTLDKIQDVKGGAK